MTIGRPCYKGSKDRPHDKEHRIGILVANLGSPNAPTAAKLRLYLRQFLSDTRVIEEPRWLWFFILNLIVVPFRSPKSAKAYQEIWTEEGSPLIAISNRQVAKLEIKCADMPVDIELGMSYGNPSIPSALEKLREKGMTHLLVMPMYPQYAASTVGSVFDTVTRELMSWRWVPHLRFLSGYFDSKGYVGLLAEKIKKHQQEHGRPKMTLFSFHGTQLASLVDGDPYHCQCHRTARETSAQAGIEDGKWAVSFQSRFGKDPWLEPYTIEMMRRLPQQGADDIQVICPAFSVDCLETLEEIAGENKEAFLAAGGKKFSYIPALNDDDSHIDFLAQLARKNVEDWVRTVNAANEKASADERVKLAAKIRPCTEGKEKPDVKG